MTDTTAARFSGKRITALGIILLLGAGFAAAYRFYGNDHMNLFLQTLSGNWSPPMEGSKIGQLEFSISAVVAIIINWGPLIAAFVLVYNFINKIVADEVAMPKLKKILDTHQAFLKAELEKAFGNSAEDKKKIADAFAAASGARDRMVENVFGKKVADRYKQMVERSLS